jgi:hypothetical protein
MARFQIRSNQRDKQTDSERIGSVIKVIDGAISAALHEKNSLSLRVRNALDLAAIAMGNESDEYLTREKKIQAGLKDTSSNLLAGRRGLTNWKRKSRACARYMNCCAVDFLSRPDKGGRTPGFALMAMISSR